ncbi:hypothetical protein B5S28_g160 [[Candida] boidinii]|uniref:Unnamed protein product n=1 Tax=Candida boidinii TaxID=5477 RepID=A0ACB5TK10_CANBO|nr:hypothetical protein B5S28_g160 [[Candida] boidinii]OWB70588.1 hypothetical protein B5S31_g267 [[Candida] boidinii]OWB76791.1 hypothetical protein B5S32_g946 [[Candida] boidinii]GME89843.1 unnamed protein product [[Candida] boidinii]
MKISTILPVVAALASITKAATPPINISGNAFWDTETGERFYIRGVDYQPGGSSDLEDPIADEEVCSRDIEYFKELGLNTIRVYSVDNSADHSKCMSLLSDAGIYLLLDVNTPDAAISRINPGCSYNADYLQHIFAVVDEFSQYNNTLGFFAGNEVVNDVDSLYTAPYIKAVVRDLKKYIKARDYRSIPVGYSAADVAEVRVELAHYLNCGNDTDARVDMLGVNDYSWCGQSSFVVSGYQQKVQMYAGYSAPIFLSEFGCNKVPGSRPFTEISSIYSLQMSSVFSGGLVYEYSQEEADYGLVNITSSNNVTILQDFTNLKGEYEKTPNPSGDGGYSSYDPPSQCPTSWNFSITVPDTPKKALTYFDNGAGEGWGFDDTTESSCDDDDDTYYVSTSNVPSSSSTTSSSSSSSSTASSSSSAASSSSSSSSKGDAAIISAFGYSNFALLFLISLF